MLKKEVLRDPRDFKAVYNKGKSKADRFVVVFYRPNGRNYTRTCFLASKKVGNAVERNRARLWNGIPDSDPAADGAGKATED